MVVRWWRPPAQRPGTRRAGRPTGGPAAAHHHAGGLAALRRRHRPATSTLLPNADWDALDAAARLDYDEARIKHHAELIVVTTSTIREIVHQGRLLMPAQPARDRRPPRPDRLRARRHRQDHRHQAARPHPRAAHPQAPPRQRPHPGRLRHRPAQGAPHKLAMEFARFLGLPPSGPAKHHRHHRRRLRGPHRRPHRPGHRRRDPQPQPGTSAGEDLSDHLKYFTEHLPATFVYAGIDVERAGLFTGIRGEQIAGRFALIRTGPFPYQREWKGLVATLEHTLRLHHHQPGTLTRLDRYLHQRTGGMIGSLSHLIRAAAISAILDGSERVTSSCWTPSRSTTPPNPPPAAPAAMPPNATLGRTDPGVRPPVRRLPITTPPFPSETVGSYVHRLAIANHLHPGEFELYLRHRKRHVNPTGLAGVSGRPLSLLQRALPELCPALDLPAGFDHHEPTLACRYCTAARGITGTVTCWAPPHRNVCLRHRRWVGHIDPAFQGLLEGRDPQPDLTLLPDVVTAERRLRRLARRHGQEQVILAYRTGLHVALRWADRNDWGYHRHRRLQLLGFVPATDWRFPSWDPVLRAAVYPEAVAVTSLVLSPYWAGVAADPRERRRFYAEAARRLRLPAYHPDSAYDPLAQWASHYADFDKGNTTVLPGSPGPQAPSPTIDSESAAATAGRRPIQRRSRRPAASPWSGKATPATSTLARALDTRPDLRTGTDRSDTRASQGRAGSQATTANTRRCYRSDLADFEGYCLEQQLPVRLPIPPATITAYLSACAQLRPAPSLATLTRRLYAIRKVHELNGYAGFDNPAGIMTCGSFAAACATSSPGPSSRPTPPPPRTSAAWSRPARRSGSSDCETGPCCCSAMSR